jgi:DNA-binding LacI/PurR family transcriptional regulator
MPRKSVSLQDIANELNISVSTVSRALKNHPDIGTKLKNKVFETANKLNYSLPFQPEESKKTATKAIGVIVPNMERNFYASIISGIENYAKSNGYFIIIANSRESYQNEVDCVENLIKLKVDGLILSLTQETVDFSHFDHARDKDIPMVFFDRVCRTNEFSSVIADNSDAAKALTVHLHQSGAKYIAHIAGPQKLYITKERITGYLRGLEENKSTFNEEHLVYCDLTQEGAINALHKLMKAKEVPDAIFCVNDTVAFVVMKELKRKGFRIPGDIALTGFNNDFHSPFVEPALTTMFHPTFELGEETARLLIKQIESLHPHSPRQIVMKTSLVVRESSIKGLGHVY